MMSAVSAAEQTDADPAPAAPAQSVLSQLPRTRPQRSTARRTASRDAARSATATKPAPARRKRAVKAAAPGARAKGATGTKAAVKRAAKAAPVTPRAAVRKPARKTAVRGRTPARAHDEQAVPPQGYASDSERLSGSVPPPGSAEFVATAAELLSELAKAGASGGERAVKGLLSRLRLS
jgi:hypothetical protein